MNLENEKTLNLNELIKMENEYDIEIVKKAYEEYLKSGKKAGQFLNFGKKQVFDIKFTICSSYNLTKNNCNYII